MASNAPAVTVGDKNTPGLKTGTQLSSLVYYYHPSPAGEPTDVTAPKLILLATWMDARDAHIAKYVTRYQALYPTSSILLVKSSFMCFLRPKTARRDLQPAVHVIRNEVGAAETFDEKPQMLVHLFSNGGSCMLHYLYDEYARVPERSGASARHKSDQSVLPPHVTIFDSVPGRWTYHGSTGAVLESVPSGWARHLAFPFVHLLGAFWWIKYRALEIPEETFVWGLSHNDPAKALETCRAYVYSEADNMVNFRAVEAHADDAETKGYIVICRDRFTDSHHVAHARADPERYWCLVRDTWDSRFRVVEGKRLRRGSLYQGQTVALL